MGTDSHTGLLIIGVEDVVAVGFVSDAIIDEELHHKFCTTDVTESDAFCDCALPRSVFIDAVPWLLVVAVWHALALVADSASR